MSMPRSSDSALSTTRRQWSAFLYVAGNDNGLSPGLVHKPLGLLGILVLAQVGNEDVRPFPCKSKRDRSTDPAVGAGDDRLLVHEPARSAISPFAMIRHRLHRRRCSGHGLLLPGKRRGRM